MSKLRVTPTNADSHVIWYEGIACHVRHEGAGQYNKRFFELLLGSGADLNDRSPEAVRLREGMVAKAMIGTMVVGIEPFSVTLEDGETVSFDFDAQSEEEEYETQGEELLAIDEGLRDHLYHYCQRRENFRVAREIESLGNSKPPSVTSNGSAGETSTISTDKSKREKTSRASSKGTKTRKTDRATMSSAI